MHEVKRIQEKNKYIYDPDMLLVYFTNKNCIDDILPDEFNVCTCSNYLISLSCFDVVFYLNLFFFHAFVHLFYHFSSLFSFLRPILLLFFFLIFFFALSFSIQLLIPLCSMQCTTHIIFMIIIVIIAFMCVFK